MGYQKRGLSDRFMQDLLCGFLNPLLSYIKKNDTLLLCIRADYINIYYRGGNLLRLERNPRNNSYGAFFNIAYGQSDQIQHLPTVLSEKWQVELWINSFPILKQVMDEYMTAHPAMEREFQQLVVRENNYSPISNETEYFIIDIEASYPEIGAKFDLVACKWLAGGRKKDVVQLVLIEMKYADSALEGEAGIIKHLADANTLLSDLERNAALRMSAEKQLNQLNELGLLRHSKVNNRKFIFSPEKAELVLLLANHNPRSSRLAGILDSEEIKGFSDENSNPFKLRFVAASAAGYGMHDACMLPLDTFRQTHFLNTAFIK